jgi:mannose/cellobiose epimerase-like protein (N-acyl-D-glucosamine 2-epimerase family)
VALSVPHDLLSAYEGLRGWLAAHAYDVWWTHGADKICGGFLESLNLDGSSRGEPKRARLHPRQIFCFANAARFGWAGPAREAVSHGLSFFLEHYRRPDGLYRTRVARDGASVDESVVLYDQAFALLGLASAHAALGERHIRVAAHELHDRVLSAFGRPDGGFNETEPSSVPLTSNSHMHLLEASLAWHEVDGDARWLKLAAPIVEIALTHWIEPRGGAMREFFTMDWRPTADEGRRAEPGHQYEWAWLLLRYGGYASDARITPVALRLIEFGETYGVDPARRVAINACLDDGAPLDRTARLWPQAERIKANCLAGERTGEPRYFRIAQAATRVLMSYFDTPLQGLWRDRLLENGSFVAEPAPASSFYHIVSAAAELKRVSHRG